jgi:hypothetical protein
MTQLDMFDGQMLIEIGYNGTIIIAIPFDSGKEACAHLAKEEAIALRDTLTAIIELEVRNG